MNEKIVINEEALKYVIIPLVESFIAALESSSSKTEIKIQVEQLLESIKGASFRISAKNTTPQTDAASLAPVEDK